MPILGTRKRGGEQKTRGSACVCNKAISMNAVNFETDDLFEVGFGADCAEHTMAADIELNFGGYDLCRPEVSKTN
jgi:hypothetical protein